MPSVHLSTYHGIFPLQSAKIIAIVISILKIKTKYESIDPKLSIKPEPEYIVSVSILF